MTKQHGKVKMLLNTIERIASEANNTGLFLNVNRYNNAQDFYKKLGYSIVKTIDNERGNG